MHGEYFSAETDKEDYLDQVYKKVIQYLNKNIFEKKLIEENIGNPQRHPDGNKERMGEWLKGEKFDLRELVEKCDSDRKNFSKLNSCNPPKNY